MSLPAPESGFQRFAIQESPIMEPALAARHSDISTYNGRGIDDPTATIRLDLTPQGFHASVRGTHGTWYIDPYYHRDRSVYASYFAGDLENTHGEFVERGLEALNEHATVPDEAPTEALRSAGDQLRTYRLALVSDPGYADFHGAANVTAAKVTLMNRVTQIYEDETSIRMLLVASNDLLNLNTAALAWEPNGPCGAAACFTQTQLDPEDGGCTGGLLNRNRIVIGQVIGASNYDIGHIGLGIPGGGVAGLGVVGRDGKARGCTGLPQPTGDFFAVDYVAHEMGHQYSGNHTFNGTQHNCLAPNRNLANSVEPGSGSSIMAYAGICRQDDLQPHSDPYWSQRSFDEITQYVTSSRAAINEVQTASLRGFDTDGDSFTLTFDENTSSPLIRGTTYNQAGIEDALRSIGVTGTVRGFGGSDFVDDTGFQVTFTGAQAAMNASPIMITDPYLMEGWVGETAKGGPVDNQGHTITATGNTPPSVTAAADYTIPYRTPFALTGAATDADGDALTYMWEQNDAGTDAGTALVNPAKTNGPLFRQFGTALQQPPYDPAQYGAAGENHATSDPTRVFPDMAQILANNTNAETGDCPGAPPPPPPISGGTNVPQPLIDCYSEFLPTATYLGPMNFRLTARDHHPGGGGVNSDDTRISLAPGTGPFLVTSQGTAVSYSSSSTQTVTWEPAGTAASPVNASTVNILLSTDGGATFPRVLAANTPNDGSQNVVIPTADTTTARIMVKPGDNVFFDVSNVDFTITNTAPVAVNNATSPAEVPQGQALSPPVTVTGTDADSFGSDLQATPSGLPAGMTLEVTSTSANGVLPGERTWTVSGAPTSPLGTYPVTVTVSDGVAEDETTFSLKVVEGNTDLAVTSSASASSTRVGRLLTYTVVVRRNTGSRGDGQLRVALPPGAIHVSSATDPAAGCSRTVDTVTCALGFLGVGDSSEFRFVIVPTSRGTAQVRASVSSAIADTNPGNDNVTAATRVKRAECTIRGTPGRDVLRGTNGSDVICGRGGADRILGRGGADVIFGGGSDDNLAGGRDRDVVDGGGGDDRIRVRDGISGNDAALGRGGSNRCVSDQGDVVLGCR